MWSEEPGWYAIALSLISLLVSLLVLSHNRRAARAAVLQQLRQRAVEIDEAFAHHRVAMPYEHRLTAAFPSNVVTLLQQINLLREVFEHRDVLGEPGVEAYQNRAKVMAPPGSNQTKHCARAGRCSERVEAAKAWTFKAGLCM